MTKLDEMTDGAPRRDGQMISTPETTVTPEGPNPFDPRTEVSADARYIAQKIIKHMWILFVGLPIVALLVIQILK
jgi:hypothetical protein